MPLFLLILISVCSGVAGQISIKLGANSSLTESEAFNVIDTFHLILGSPWVLSGFLLYAFSAFCWVAVLRRADLSFAYAFVAIGYVLIAIVSRLVLGETIPTGRWFGLLVICFGILLVSRTGP